MDIDPLMRAMPADLWDRVVDRIVDRLLADAQPRDDAGYVGYGWVRPRGEGWRRGPAHHPSDGVFAKARAGGENYVCLGNTPDAFGLSHRLDDDDTVSRRHTGRPLTETERAAADAMDDARRRWDVS